MDFVTLAMAKNYADSQRLGYTEPGTALEWDGDASNVVTIGMYPTVRIHDKYLDLNNVAGIYAVSDIHPNLGGAMVPPETLTVDALGRLQVMGTSCSLLLPNREESYALLISVPSDLSTEELDEIGTVAEGVYAVVVEAMGRIARITFSETVHQIDPKFIPNTGGAGLPLVELTTAFTPEQTEVTAAEAAMLDERAAEGIPFLVKMNMMGTPMTTLAMVIFEYSGEVAGFAPLLSVGFGAAALLQRDEGHWFAQLQQVSAESV